MKTIKTYFAIVLAALAFVSCSDGGYKNAVPKNADMVVEVNFKSLFNGEELPADVTENLKLIMGQFLSGDDNKDTEQIIDGEKSMGIDFSEPFYIFRSPDVEAAACFKVSDTEDLKNFIATLRDRHLCSAISEKDGKQWATLLDEATMAFDDDVLIICAKKNAAAKKMVSKMFEAGEEDSFTATGNFKKMESKNSGLVLFANFSEMGADEDMDIEDVVGFLLQGVKMSDVNFVLDMQLGKGRLDLNAEIFSDKEDVQKKLEDNSNGLKKISGDFIKAPKDFMVWFGIGADGEKFYNFLNNSEAAKSILVVLERAIDIEKIIKAIDGDLALVVPDVPSIDKDFVLAAKTKNQDFLKDVDYWTIQMQDWKFNMSKVAENEYAIKFDDESQLKWGVDGNNFFLSSENGDYAKTFANTNAKLDEVASEIKNSVAYLYYDLNPLADFMEQNDMSKGMELDLMRKVERITFSAKDCCNCSFTIALTDKENGFITTVINEAKKALFSNLLN